jgi:hypothetical protein
MKANEVYLASIDKWAKRRGIGTISYDTSLDLFEPIKIVLLKYFAKNPNSKVIIVVANEQRIDIWSTKLLSASELFSKIGNGLLNFITIDKIIVDKFKGEVELLIFDQIDRFLEAERLEVVKQKYIKSKYILGVTNVAYPDNDKFNLYESCPIIDRVTKVDVITHGILDGAVEYNIGVNMLDNDLIYYNEINQYIKDTVELFGDFDTIMRCYHGDPNVGISADYYRQKLATEKGWETDMDLSNEYYKNLDRYYNPNSIYERAKAFTDVIKKRQILLSDNYAKINVIVNIIAKYKDSKVLIINKRAPFAKVVCNAINEVVESNNLKYDIVSGTLFKPAEKLVGKGSMSDLVCVEYHPDVESRPLIDPSIGDYVRIKSGKDAGKTKMYGATSLNKIANERFNEGYHNVISSISSIPKEANFEIDFIVITSPECNTFNQLQYRAANLKFKNNVKIINVFLNNTKEKEKLKEKQSLNTNKVIEIFDIKDLNL